MSELLNIFLAVVFSVVNASPAIVSVNSVDMPSPKIEGKVTDMPSPKINGKVSDIPSPVVDDKIEKKNIPSDFV